MFGHRMDRPGGLSYLHRLAVPLRIVEMVVRMHEIVDGEVILAVVQPRAASDDLLNSIIEFTGRMSTMLRILRASTPVESFCDVVRMVRSEEHTSELQSVRHLVCRLLL